MTMKGWVWHPAFSFSDPRPMRSGSHNQIVSRNFLLLGSILAFLSVACGAFGAHALKDRLSSEALAIFQTGVQYQTWHSLALLLVGVLALHVKEIRKLRTAGWLFVAGLFVFSGSLYALALSGIK